MEEGSYGDAYDLRTKICRVLWKRVKELTEFRLLRHVTVSRWKCRVGVITALVIVVFDR